MIEIEKPKIECIEMSEDYILGSSCGTLERGYGTTLGNSLRRYCFHHFRELL